MDDQGFSDGALTPPERRGTRGLLAISPELKGIVTRENFRRQTWTLLRSAIIGFLMMIPAIALGIQLWKSFTGK